MIRAPAASRRRADVGPQRVSAGAGRPRRRQDDRGQAATAREASPGRPGGPGGPRGQPAARPAAGRQPCRGTGPETRRSDSGTGSGRKNMPTTSARVPPRTSPAGPAAAWRPGATATGAAHDQQRQQQDDDRTVVPPSVTWTASRTMCCITAMSVSPSCPGTGSTRHRVRRGPRPDLGHEQASRRSAGGPGRRTAAPARRSQPRPRPRTERPADTVGRQSAITTSTGTIAHGSTAPANPNATPPQVSRLALASRSRSNTAMAPGRQNSTSHGSTSTVCGGRDAHGKTARIPQAVKVANTPRWRTSNPSRSTPAALASAVSSRPMPMPQAVPVTLASSAAGHHQQGDPGRLHQDEVAVGQDTVSQPDGASEVGPVVVLGEPQQVARPAELPQPQGQRQRRL